MVEAVEGKPPGGVVMVHIKWERRRGQREAPGGDAGGGPRWLTHVVGRRKGASGGGKKKIWGCWRLEHEEFFWWRVCFVLFVNWFTHREEDG